MTYLLHIAGENQITAVVMFLESIFGISFTYLLGFFCKLTLIFIGSAIISKFFHLDKVYDDSIN